MAEQFVGVWKNDPSTTQGLDEFMDVLKVDPARRETWRNMLRTTEYKKDGDQWTVIVTVPGRPNPHVVKFKSGETIETEGFEGQKIKTTINVNGGKMTETQFITSENFGPTPKKFEITRELKGNTILVTNTVEGKTMTTNMVKQ